MSGEKLTLEDMPDGALPRGWTPELPPEAIGWRVHGPGLPKEGVLLTRDEVEAGVVAVACDPPRSAHAVNGRSLV